MIFRTCPKLIFKKYIFLRSFFRLIYFSGILFLQCFFLHLQQFTEATSKTGQKGLGQWPKHSAGTDNWHAQQIGHKKCIFLHFNNKTFISILECLTLSHDLRFDLSLKLLLVELFFFYIIFQAFLSTFFFISQKYFKIILQGKIDSIKC